MIVNFKYFLVHFALDEEIDAWGQAGRN